MNKVKMIKQYFLTMSILWMWLSHSAYALDAVNKNCQYEREIIVAVKIKPDLHEVYNVTQSGRQVTMLKDAVNLLNTVEYGADDIADTLVSIYAYKTKAQLEEHGKNRADFKIFFIPLNRDVLPADIGLGKDWRFTHMYMGYDLTKKDPYTNKIRMYGLIKPKKGHPPQLTG